MSRHLRPPTIRQDYLALLDSDRVSGRTRQIMEKRAQTSDAEYEPRHLSRQAYDVLRFLTARVLPQDTVLKNAPINLAARIDVRLGGAGDGWRFASLPPDPEAYERALTGLNTHAVIQHGAAFTAINCEVQDLLIDALTKGTLSTEKLNKSQMRYWFTDLRADCVQIFISDPAVQAQLGIDAIFNGGDDHFQGFSGITTGKDEEWEPTPEGFTA